MRMHRTSVGPIYPFLCMSYVFLSIFVVCEFSFWFPFQLVFIFVVRENDLNCTFYTFYNLEKEPRGQRSGYRRRMSNIGLLTRFMIQNLKYLKLVKKKVAELLIFSPFIQEKGQVISRRWYFVLPGISSSWQFMWYKLTRYSFMCNQFETLREMIWSSFCS